ncbi:MAG: HD domain-containing protein, partial [Dehalococcoidales bacterium]|nr:HD domain-containing protein [Dehalococcoidales bacterium]
GFIRDAILKRNTADIDIAVTTDALEFAPGLAQALDGKFIPMDKENRVCRIILKNTNDANRQQVDISTVKATIELDLGQRDFTINALAVPLKDIADIIKEADIIDPFKGLSDIQGKIIRIVSDKAFKMDALRLLRGARLASELDFVIDSHTEELIKKHCSLIEDVPGERIREELLRIFAVPRTGRLLLYLEDMGLITAILPELAPSKGLQQQYEHHWDVFIHSVKTVDAIGFVLKQGKWEYDTKAAAHIPWSVELAEYFNEEISGGGTRLLLIKLAALLHDIAKPKTRFIDGEGKTRFFGHPREGAPIAADILKRLRFSSKETGIVESIVLHHLRPTQMTQTGAPTDKAIYRYFRDVTDVAIDTLFFSLADHLATRGPNLDLTNWQQHTTMINYILNKHFEQEKMIAPPGIISGDDLIREFKLKPGKRIGELLEAIREAQASAEIVSREDALAYINRLLNM